MTKAYDHLKALNEGLMATIERQREQIAQLTAANARHYERRWA